MNSAIGSRNVTGEPFGVADGVAVAYRLKFKGFAFPRVGVVSAVYIEDAGGRTKLSESQYQAVDGVVTFAIAPLKGANLSWDGSVLWTEYARLLPSNASPAELALEGATARIGELATPLRSLWNPDACPTDLLPWLAWALSIDAWKSYWPEHIKRARVRTAIQIQRAKGTSKSVRDVVAAFGGQVVLSEWWQQSPAGTPHTFAMTLTLSGEGGETATAQFVDDVIAEVERTKPVRSHFTFTQGANVAGAIGVVAVARPVIYTRLQFDAI